MGIVAKEPEFSRISALLEESGKSAKSALRIDPSGAHNTAAAQTDRLREVVEVYGLDTLIFSGEDVSSQKIIEMMATVESGRLQFKIAPPESLYIIGSNSVDKGGDLFMLDLNAVSKPSNRRKKRILDLSVAFFLFLSSPILIFWVENKGGFFGNIGSVLAGAKTWVSYTGSAHERAGLPIIKKGVLSTQARLKRHPISSELAKKLNTVYARQYSLRTDLAIIASGMRKLGNKT